MQYLHDKFNVTYGSKEYREGWERIFAKKGLKEKEVADKEDKEDEDKSDSAAVDNHG
jgi:hypothetical protein